MWDQAADLFAGDGTIELGQQGVYVGKARVRQFLKSLGHDGLVDGWMNDHIQLQPIVDVGVDLAWARVRELAMTGVFQDHGTWTEGVYENVYVKQNGVWKIATLHFYPTVITNYDQGWGKDAQPAPGVNPALPPDRPPSEVYETYPKAHMAPLHYRNPVTDAPPRYPPGMESKAGYTLYRAFGGHRHATAGALLAEAERTIARVKDWHELENLEDAYGYYLDKNLWNDIADLFATDGSMELAQRGVYVGRERVRGFLTHVFGPEGPQANRLGNHMQLQPVIHVSPDGKTAKIRVRLLQQLGSYGGRASWGGGVYENEAVKEDGVWKFKSEHVFNTFTADYDGGWAKAPGRGLPGPSKTYPPDRPPSMVFAMFPSVYAIPFHYKNPVTRK
jgi:hypothetical protein